jgi:hypothetical protein
MNNSGLVKSGDINNERWQAAGDLDLNDTVLNERHIHNNIYIYIYI